MIAFRNVDVDRVAPIETWPYEALVAIIERGTVSDWVLITRELHRDPWGPVSRQLEDYLGYERPYGVAPLLERRIARARAEAERRERALVAQEVAQLIDRSGYSMAELASRIGTSRPRLSTYRSGSVVPSAAMLQRIRDVVARSPHADAPPLSAGFTHTDVLPALTT